MNIELTREERWLIEGCLLLRMADLRKTLECAMSIDHAGLIEVYKKDIQEIDALKNKITEVFYESCAQKL